MRAALAASALAASAALILAGCSPAARVTGADPGAAATVNGVVVSMADAERRIELSSANEQAAAQLEADETGQARRLLEANALTGLILSELLAQGAEELGISITDEDIKAARAEVVEAIPGGEEGFQEVLAQEGLTEADIEPLLRDRAHQERIEAALAGDAEVTDEDIQAHFDENPEGRYGATASARHILVETEPEAQEVIERLEAGEDFGDIAREVSIDPGAQENGGDLGTFGREQMVPEFSEAVFAADAGDVVGPVQTQFGFHVIEVLEVIEAPALADVEDEIRAELEAGAPARAAGEWLEQRYAEAEITVNPRFGQWDPAQTRVVPAAPLGETTPGDAPATPGDVPATPQPTE